MIIIIKTDFAAADVSYMKHARDVDKCNGFECHLPQRSIQ